jgi:NAD(P)-dependent dehydrogenase (short-subunit alcohol dehydrogenase family)
MSEQSVAARHCVVTGGSGDIGRAICEVLAQDGYLVTMADVVDQEKGSAIAREVAAAAGGRVTYRLVDQTSPGEVEKLFADLGQVELVVVAAGTVTAQPFLDIELSAWERQMSVNLTGAFVVAQQAAKTMVAHGTAGQVIFISSWVAARPWPEITAYTASKAGLDQLMRQMALELAPHRVRANAVAPGIVLAGLAKGQLENEPEYARRVATAIPLGELQTAQDIAHSVRFLASPGASTMTGSVLLVDSGCSLGQVR